MRGDSGCARSTVRLRLALGRVIPGAPASRAAATAASPSPSPLAPAELPGRRRRSSSSSSLSSTVGPEPEDQPVLTNHQSQGDSNKCKGAFACVVRDFVCFSPTSGRKDYSANCAFYAKYLFLLEINEADVCVFFVCVGQQRLKLISK